MNWADCADTQQVVLEALFGTWAQQAGLNYLGPGHAPEAGHYVVLTRADAGDGARYTVDLVDPSTGGCTRLSAAVMRPEQVLRVLPLMLMLPLMLIDGDHPWGEKVAPARLFATGSVVPRGLHVRLPDPCETVLHRLPDGRLVPGAAPPPQPCEPCGGRGWLISECDCPTCGCGPSHVVQRCDTCKVFTTDEAAADAARTWVRSHE